MDTEEFKSNIVTNLYHITSDKKVNLHKHQHHDEVFYCIKGEGFGGLENEEIELNVGKVFIVLADTLHALRTNSNLWVSSFLIPVVVDEM